MNPEFIDKMTWAMAEVYGAVTDQILINLAHYFPYWKPGEPVPKSSFEYQANMLAQMGKVDKDTIQIIRNGLDGANNALLRTLQQAIIESVKKAQPELLEGVKQGILKPAGVPIVTPNQMRAFKLYYKQSVDGLNLVNTVMLESTKQAYLETVSDITNRIEATQSALNIATGETITGVSSWNQALKHATDRMKERGIVGFIDHAGRRWSAESYVAMDIRTTVANTARAATWETNENFGNDLYQVSYHNGARPLCYPFQNKVVSSTDNARTVTDLDGNEIQVIAQSATTYGQAAGLFGINCKHYPTPFIPGVSIIRGEPQDEETNRRVYEESQEQRRLERKLREQKRDVMMAKAQGAPESTVKALREKANATSDEIEDFCTQTGRTRRRNREGVYTKRDFPDANTYDVEWFDEYQRDKINEFYNNGGVQQHYSFGQMKPKAQQTSTSKGVSFDRKAALGKYDEKIAELENQRLKLIESDSNNWKKSDKINAELEDLKRKRAIVEKGGYTTNEATKTVESFVVNPNSTSRIELDKADVYTMPDGKKFVFKHGMNKAHQKLTPDALLSKYYELPEGFREQSQDVIAVVDKYNPADSHWKKTYKEFTQSYATGGEQIVFYRWDYEHDMDYLSIALEHEAGHLIDRNNAVDGTRFSDLTEWKDAMAKDKEVSGLESWRDYGKNSRQEDFADSVAYYLSNHDDFVKKMPNRSAIIKRLLSM